MLAPVMECNYIREPERICPACFNAGCQSRKYESIEAAGNSGEAAVTLADDLRTPRQLREIGGAGKRYSSTCRRCYESTRLLVNNTKVLEIAMGKPFIELSSDENLN